MGAVRHHVRGTILFALILATPLIPFGGCGGSTIIAEQGPPPQILGFPQPPEIFSSQGGFIQAGLDCQIATNAVGGMQVTGPTYNGSLIGPTFRMRPGATVFRLNIRNLFPANPAQARTGAFPHDRYTTNLHTHGWTVDPTGMGDNVFRTMEPNTLNEFIVTLAPGHPSGTFWYHPHKHGSATYQFMGGMAGFLIIEGGPGSLDDLPEIKAAKEYVMGFQTIRTNANGTVPWVNTNATNFQQLWNTLEDGKLFITTNGVVAPTLRMFPGEVQRWRLLNATPGETIALALEQHDLHLLAQDGLTMPNMVTMGPVEDLPIPGFGPQPYILAAGNRLDVLVKAGQPGTYKLMALNTNPNISAMPPEQAVFASVSHQNIAPDFRVTRAFPGPSPGPTTIPQWQFPVTLVNVVVSGNPVNMDLPAGPLPVPPILDTQGVLNATPDETRNIAFEICNSTNPPNCMAYQNRYDAAYWGGTDFSSWLFMRDADDTRFVKEALFKHNEPLFDDMCVDNIEEWTVTNNSPSDHPFHIHVNPFLLTHINGIPLPVPEWRDTVIVPGTTAGNPVGSVTFRTHFHANFTGNFVAHCHVLSHEDVGMMQELEIKTCP